MSELPYKLLVFDWDGTLMDSAAEIVYCFQQACADLDIEVPTEAQIKSIIGIGMQEAIAALFPQMDPGDYSGLVDKYRVHYFNEERTPSSLFDGVKDMLLQLERDGYFLAVATSKGRHGLDRVLARTGLDQVFHYTRCVDEAPSKPHPQMLMDILDFMGCEPQQSLMIGDTEFDMLMAQNARMQGLAVACGAHERERLLASKPHFFLEHTNLLHDWLQKNRKTDNT